MRKLRKKPLSVREETFALANCGCACACKCKDSCDCPIAPTHQIGLNAMSDINPSKDSSNNTDNGVFVSGSAL